MELIKDMAGQFADELVAATLNHLGVCTGKGNTWKTKSLLFAVI